MLYAVTTAVLAGLCGVLFNTGLLNISTFYNLPLFKNSWRKIVFSLLCAGILGFTLPQVLGGGNLLVNELALKTFPLHLLFILLIG